MPRYAEMASNLRSAGQVPAHELPIVDRPGCESRVHLPRSIGARRLRSRTGGPDDRERVTRAAISCRRPGSNEMADRHPGRGGHPARPHALAGPGCQHRHPDPVPGSLLADQRHHRPGLTDLGPQPVGLEDLRRHPGDCRRHGRDPASALLEHPGHQHAGHLHGHSGTGLRRHEPGTRLQCRRRLGPGHPGRGGHRHRPGADLQLARGSAGGLPVVLGAFILVGGIASIIMAFRMD